ncbi:hypothetical protein BOTCAL_0521g00010 [Botryotinia calthae]|uniref:Uncharacterized protein n=1 Tax=Botryotinia calthae TaxID=38488 RepID=A0A4Y8CKS3_9HELO|nr:hypothetical protein BOTCAL_0521g00010 [Botryotinia calthae]
MSSSVGKRSNWELEREQMDGHGGIECYRGRSGEDIFSKWWRCGCSPTITVQVPYLAFPSQEVRDTNCSGSFCSQRTIYFKDPPVMSKDPEPTINSYTHYQMSSGTLIEYSSVR